MNNKERLQQWIMFKTENWWGWTEKPIWIVQDAICYLFGHSPTPDQCNKPEHDFCSWCLRLTPSEVPRTEKGEVIWYD